MDKYNQKIRLSYHDFLSIPFHCGEFITSDLELLDERAIEYPHSHSEYEVYFCLEGSLKLTVDGVAHDLFADDFLFIKPGVIHDVLDDIRTQRLYFICIFHPALNDQIEPIGYERDFLSFWKGLFGDKNYVLGHDERESALLIHKLIHALNSREFAWELETRGIISELFLNLIRNYTPTAQKNLGSASGPVRNLAVEIDLFIHANCKRELSLQEIADTFHMTPRSVNRLLQKAYGISYQTILANSRLRAAKEYLIETDYSVGEIAELVGFSSPQPLFRLFRTYDGLNPSEYRLIHQAQKDK